MEYAASMLKKEEEVLSLSGMGAQKPDRIVCQ